MRGRETASANNSRTSANRSPVGILGGRQSCSLVEFRRSPTPSTELLQQWRSRSHSVQSLPARFSHTATPYNQEEGRKLSGRHTKTSLLRMQNCVVPSAEPNYRELAKKKKHFAVDLKCKALATTNARLPDGGSIHAFLTGARYNSAHHIDSRSLERLGLYIPRGNTSKPFVNPAGTLPPSPAIYGLKGCSKHSSSRLSDSHGFIYPDIPPRRAHSNTGLCVNSTPRYMYGGTGTSDREGGTASMASIDKEIEEVFGPSQGGSESESSSMIGQCEVEDSGSVKSATSAEILSCSEDETELISVVGEVARKQKPLDTVGEFEEKNKLETCTPNAVRNHDRLAPSSLITLSEKPLVNIVAESLVEVEEGFREPLLDLDSAIQGEPETTTCNQLDLISPEAQMITDQILRECRSSSCSLGSSLSESATELEVVEVHTPIKHQHTQTEPIQTHIERPASSTKEPASLRPKSAESDVQLSARSIFVDLSLTSLQAESNGEDDD